MSDYGSQAGSPYSWDRFQPRKKQLIWSRTWDHAGAGLGDFFNTDPDTVNFPDIARAIDADQGCLTVRAGNLQNIGNTSFGSPWPRGTSFLLPEWLQDGSPDQVPPWLPNLDGFPFIQFQRAIVIYARLRFRSLVGTDVSYNPFVDVMPVAELFLGPEAFVGNQPVPMPFMMQGIWPDFGLGSDSPDTPPATWSSNADPPLDFSNEGFWGRRPGAVTQEQWQDAATAATDVYWNPLQGNSVILRTLIIADPKFPGNGFQCKCWASSDGADWVFTGDRAFANTPDLNATCVRRVGLSVRGLGYAALDFVHVYYAQASDITALQDLTDLEPWYFVDAMPSPGARYFKSL